MHNLQIISIGLLAVSSTCRASRLSPAVSIYRRDGNLNEYKTRVGDVDTNIQIAIKCYEDFLPKVSKWTPPHQETLDSIYACDKYYNLTSKALGNAREALGNDDVALTDKLFNDKLPDITDRRTTGQGEYTQKLQASREQLEDVSSKAGEAFKNGTEALKKVTDVLKEFPDVLTNDTFKTIQKRVVRSIDVTNARVEIRTKSDGSLDGVVVVGLVIAGVVLSIKIVTAQSFVMACAKFGRLFQAAKSSTETLSALMTELESVPIEDVTIGKMARARTAVRDADVKLEKALQAAIRVSNRLPSVPAAESREAHSIFAAQFRQTREASDTFLDLSSRYEQLKGKVDGMISL
ncbi:hypothetical protein CP533_5201 [Ophiocordyceps camponoti-saundersi (nom. inval.)]|nr:hypothetical protein CP533_5201 [Ophiocordyceps camponoti-saundersi (nom. inval.)]